MRQALGKGLEALIPATHTAAKEGQRGQEGLEKIAIDRIRPNRTQPRKSFKDAALTELAQSIKEHGLAQPLLVTRGPDGDFELIAGERRLRAARLAGLGEVPAVVRDEVPDQGRLVLALIENIQREDLNPVEEAQAFKRMMDDHSLNQTQLATMLGKSRPALANTLRLLDLPGEVQDEIIRGGLTEGHGRALLMVEDASLRRTLFERTVKLRLSVRQLEAATRSAKKGGKDRRQNHLPLEIKNLEMELQRQFGTKVRIRCSKKGVGAIAIEFYSLPDLERVVRVLKSP